MAALVKLAPARIAPTVVNQGSLRTPSAPARPKPTGMLIPSPTVVAPPLLPHQAGSSGAKQSKKS